MYFKMVNAAAHRCKGKLVCKGKVSYTVLVTSDSRFYAELPSRLSAEYRAV